MVWVAVDNDGTEWLFEDIPHRMNEDQFGCRGYEIEIPSGSIEKLIGRKLTWSDEPIELTDQ